MPRRPILALTLAVTGLLMLGGATTSQASPGSLRILFDSNQGDGDFTAFLPALRGMPGVGAVDTFDSSSATPSQEALAGYDLVVDGGDNFYDDAALYGDRLANYIDTGGAVIQFAYDNWENIGAHPEGRFESGGYPPFIPGDNVNDATTLGEIVVPGNPVLAGVPTFATDDNVDDALSPGATLLARFADARNAIATKGPVVSVAASPEDGGGFDPISAAAQLAVNAGNVLGPRTLTVSKSGKGSGTVTSSPTRIDCGATCSARVGGGASITLSATATAGAFTGWSGAGCTGVSTCTIAMNSADRAVTAKFDACVVPKLKGRTLKRAKKRLKGAECRLGKAKGRGKVTKQRPKPGTVLPPDRKVKVTLR
jgi:hypothetical protein